MNQRGEEERKDMCSEKEIQEGDSVSMYMYYWVSQKYAQVFLTALCFELLTKILLSQYKYALYSFPKGLLAVQDVLAHFI